MKSFKQILNTFTKQSKSLDSNESTFYDNNWENIEDMVFNNNDDTWNQDLVIVCIMNRYIYIQRNINFLIPFFLFSHLKKMKSPTLPQ